MDLRRIAMAVGVALGLSLLLTYFVYNRLQQQSSAKRPTTQIVAAAHDLDAGVALQNQDLQLVDWPASLPIKGSYTKVGDVAGHPLIYPVNAGEPVLERSLADPDSGIGLTVKIPQGMRATAVRSNEIVGVAGFLFPGSRVDVLTTIQQGSAPAVTRTILQNVQVLAAGQKVQPDPTGKPETVSVVTLLLSPEDSEKLLLISSMGNIQFVLRNGSDSQHGDVSPVSLSELTTGEKPKEAPAPPKPARGAVPAPVKVAPPPPPKPPEAYTVEVINGNRRSTEKFPDGTTAQP